MTSQARVFLGSCLLAQKKYAEAEALLLQGYEGLKERQATLAGPGRRWLTEATERLVRYYESTQQPDQARLWREKLASDNRPGS